MEPPEIRELYNEYAKVERINHQNAHPTYKFSPSKTATPAKRRKGEFSEDEEPSDLDDAEWDPPGHRRIRNKTSKRPERGASYGSNSMNTDFFDRTFGPNDTINKSTWEMTNEGRPMPLPMGQGDLYQQYFQTAMHPSMPMVIMEDPRMRKLDPQNSSMQFSQNHALLGLPGGNGADLLQQLQSHTGTPLGDEHQVDPMLLAFDGGHTHDTDPNLGISTDFRNGHLVMDRELDQASVNSILGAPDAAHHDNFHSEPWHADPTIASMEPGSEFDKWMDDHHAA